VSLPVGAVIRWFLNQGLSRLPRQKAGRLLVGLISAATAARNPTERMRLLLELDNQIYRLEGEAAKGLGDGLHTKHRHIGYHEWYTGNLSPGDRVLDVGCGVGALAGAMSRAGATVVGIDLSPDNIAEAQRRFGGDAGPQFIVGDALVDLPDEPFDVVALSNVLEHLPGRADLVRRLRATTGASLFLIRVPMFERDWRVPLKKELGVEWRLDLTHETEYRRHEFEREMLDAGLRIDDIQYCWGEIWARCAAP